MGLQPQRPLGRDGFTVAIICALPIEASAVEALFDRRWGKYGKAPNDPNAYTTGNIGDHNVVLAYMPNMGVANAAAVASYCQQSFRNIKLALVVGICGAVPLSKPESKSKMKKKEIILGDVIISKGAIQYDLGRQYPEGFERKRGLLDTLGRPSTEILSVIAKVESLHARRRIQENLVEYLGKIQEDADLGADYPGVEYDRLFAAEYRHLDDEKSCEDCGCEGKLVERDRHDEGGRTPTIEVHVGLMGSANTVMKSGETRDAIALQDNIIGFEMEAAGVWDVLPCIVIKGVCDYADSHKNDRWQQYAAATAAACMKAFLHDWETSDSIDLVVPEQPAIPQSVAPCPEPQPPADRPRPALVRASRSPSPDPEALQKRLIRVDELEGQGDSCRRAAMEPNLPMPEILARLDGAIEHFEKAVRELERVPSPGINVRKARIYLKLMNTSRDRFRRSRRRSEREFHLGRARNWSADALEIARAEREPEMEASLRFASACVDAVELRVLMKSGSPAADLPERRRKVRMKLSDMMEELEDQGHPDLLPLREQGEYYMKMIK